MNMLTSRKCNNFPENVMPLRVTKPAKKNHVGRLTICQLEGPVLNINFAKKKPAPFYKNYKKLPKIGPG